MVIALLSFLANFSENICFSNYDYHQLCNFPNCVIIVNCVILYSLCHAKASALYSLICHINASDLYSLCQAYSYLWYILLAGITLALGEKTSLMKEQCGPG